MGEARGTSIKMTLLRRGFGGLSARGEIRRSSITLLYKYSNASYAFIHGQSPCLHAEVLFLAAVFETSSGTQAWSSA
jgi:hypothetical protein